MPALIDRTGKQYGRLIVIGLSERRTNNGRPMWLCRCTCGNMCEVRGSDLATKRVVSCGCFRKECTRERSVKHGKSKNNRLYITWHNMKGRCNNPNDRYYCNYGGRGISVCKEWNDSFEAFEKWALATGYDDTMTIDKMDNNKGYSPDNCQWLTKSENSIKMHRERGHRIGKQ